MGRSFNIAGPCNPTDHYMIEAGKRITDIPGLIDEKQYFTIQAAQQGGKTTLLLDLVNKLNRDVYYYALYCSLETIQNIHDPANSIPAIVRCLKAALRFSDIPGGTAFASCADYEDYTNVLRTELTAFCMSLNRPLIIFFDEVDSLNKETLIVFFRQLRNGYNTRSQTPFVHSVALVGIRNVIGKASPFNIITKALILRNFTREEIVKLYSQHTEETGQVFEKAAIDTIWQQTQGKPWLVNAVAREAIVEILKSDYSHPITPELVERALRNIIIHRDVHLEPQKAFSE